MTNEDKYSRVVSDLRAALARMKPGQQTYEEIVRTRADVLARYQPIFSSGHIPSLMAEEFTSFLYFENNHHWSGLYRHGLRAASDMDTLRQALTLLLDEEKPI